ncbi:HDIG domain-containing metalloprotein [Bacteroides sp.]|uniref:HD family phosphohydrolase n=1 Tax=Bacteroides sp. TaxID=29523 RepID=UPI001B76F828|nr:HDIG domain-containing metalloprotein [Bacteroides sp.]MBP6065508.1 HDIG domain-containing protein [Bacteroides sp.]MBP6067495.1 HDIG domain-containing protein [Bacteroides sp.]MBP6936433.1 HDIG domain-containing protein [Bacteroides sp.]MBP8621743.1 HDIG domain-containing protein [Bacteroides sp.]MBP9507440.1 HDIG domain-containing protein [Bacteroides sp.]
MNHLQKKKRLALKDLLYKALLLIGTVAVIVYFLPREGKFNYEFDVNKPWKYGQLIAAFDFPIYKDNAVIKSEQDSLLASFQPYYQLQKETEMEMINHLKENYQSRLKSILPSADYLRYIERTLKEIYSAGIVSTEEMNLLQKDSSRSVMVIDDKLANPRTIQSLFTVKKAYERLLSGDSMHYKRDLLSQCALNDYISPNLLFDKERTQAAKKDILSSYSMSDGMVVTKQKIIDRGEIITPETYRILESLRKEYVKRSDSIEQQQLILAGQVLFVGIWILSFMLYLYLFRRDYYKNKGGLSLLFMLIIFYCIATSLMVSNNIFNVYIIPYAMIPIIIRVFLDSRTAFLTHVITMLICSITLRLPYEFLLVQVAVGMVAIFSLRELSQRSQLFRTAFLVILTYATLYFAFELITENDLSKLNLRMYTYFALNGVFLLFAYPLLFLLEKVFGFTSNVTLVELSNINNDLLRRMSELAPGTFQHSMQVANLAAEAAIRIGAKTQLVRTGALYHDIGKMENPAFFTENQLGDMNPHKSLSYEQSSQVVINHVTDGLKLAEKHNLPKAIKDFISTHHGRGKTKFFYISWKNEHPGEEPDEECFTYPGPNPFTRETAILMMADSVEAASRSLVEYTEESINNLIDKIIDSQVAEGYFKECPITFRDISIIKTVFKEKLRTAYHTRISYPELKR